MSRHLTEISEGCFVDPAVVTGFAVGIGDRLYAACQEGVEIDLPPRPNDTMSFLGTLATESGLHPIDKAYLAGYVRVHCADQHDLTVRIFPNHGQDTTALVNAWHERLASETAGTRSLIMSDGKAITIPDLPIQQPNWLQPDGPGRRTLFHALGLSI